MLESQPFNNPKPTRKWRMALHGINSRPTCNERFCIITFWNLSMLTLGIPYNITLNYKWLDLLQVCKMFEWHLGLLSFLSSMSFSQCLLLSCDGSKLGFNMSMLFQKRLSKLLAEK